MKTTTPRTSPLKPYDALQLLRTREHNVLKAIAQCFKEKNGTFIEYDVRVELRYSPSYISTALQVLVKLGIITRFKLYRDNHSRWIYIPNTERIKKVLDLLATIECYGLTRGERSILRIVELSQKKERALVVHDFPTVLCSALVSKEIKNPDGYLEAHTLGTNAYYYSPTQKGVIATLQWSSLSRLINFWRVFDIS